jgi:hypothetical protein
MKWHIYHINCDCASFRDARRRLPDPFKFMRCRFCGKQLGDMQVQYIGTFEAASDGEAIKMSRQNRRE